MLAARDGDASLVRTLLNRGAEVNAADNTGMTPLMHAVRNGHTAVVELLLDRDAYSWARNKTGMTPLMLATAQGPRRDCAPPDQAPVPTLMPALRRAIRR